MTADALNHTVALIDKLRDRCVMTAVVVCKRKRRKTLKKCDLMDAVRDVMPSAIHKDVLEDIISYTKHSHHDGLHELFSVSRADRAIRQVHLGRVGAMAKIALAAAIEWVAAELLELSWKKAKYDKKNRIEYDHVGRAIKGDPFIAELFENA
tara:strand:+ start:1163 stop:1618 length:456 start_codon:yes stop_codon:yes gene_type:complete